MVPRVSYVCVLVAQSCPTLWNPIDCSLSGSSVHGILQARILKWVPFPSPGDLPDPGIKPPSPALQTDFLPTEPLGKPNSSLSILYILYIDWSSGTKESNQFEKDLPPSMIKTKDANSEFSPLWLVGFGSRSLLVFYSGSIKPAKTPQYLL